MWRDWVDIEFQSPQDLVLVDTDVLLQLLHLVLIERLHPVCAVIDDVVQTIAEGFDAAIDAF